MIIASHSLYGSNNCKKASESFWGRAALLKALYCFVSIHTHVYSKLLRTGSSSQTYPTHGTPQLHWTIGGPQGHLGYNLKCLLNWSHPGCILRCGEVTLILLEAFARHFWFVFRGPCRFDYLWERVFLRVLKWVYHKHEGPTVLPFVNCNGNRYTNWWKLIPWTERVFCSYIRVLTIPIISGNNFWL